MLSRRHSTALAALALGASLTLTGCFSNPLDGLLEGGVGSIIENATGGIVGGVTEGELPKGFPAEIPLVAGELQGGIGLNIEGLNTWTVGVLVPGGSAADVMAHIAEQMKGAGFESSEFDAAFTAGGIATFSKDKLTVLVTVATDDDGDVTAAYVVNRGE